MVLIGILSVLALLLVTMGVIDFKARRRGMGYKGVDTSTARNDQRAYEAQMRQQMGGSDVRNFPGNTGGF
ncbi:MAG TPA: hypothetical protein VGP36_05780 [Mycobacteriales bacterium]|jgi:hypothetical protein|nr:hypothetical protein [Mycobacteriales bacterium]